MPPPCLVVGLLLTVVGTAWGQNPAARFETSFTVEKLSKGVYAFLRHDPPSLWFNPNNGLTVLHL